jgi:glycosyltransferase involved in cell wall biosynthesis
MIIKYIISNGPRFSVSFIIFSIIFKISSLKISGNKKPITIDKKKIREKYGFADSDKILIYSGRLNPEKNLELLIDVFLNLVSTNSDFKLIIVGDGLEKQNMMVKQLLFLDWATM